jgi:hypothetical protein
MSLNLIKGNSSSPFRLQRSIVDQGGQGGAYESGGYDPSNVYSDGGMAAAISSIGTLVGAAIGSRTAGDKNKEDLKKQKRLEVKVKKLKDEKAGNTNAKDANRNTRIEKRLERIGKRQENIGNRIKEYNEMEKPTLKSDIEKPKTKTEEKKVPEKKVDTTSQDWRKALLNYKF